MAGSFIIFDAKAGGSHHTSDPAATLQNKRRDVELEQAYVRSQVARFVHARRRQAAATLKAAKSKAVAPAGPPEDAASSAADGKRKKNHPAPLVKPLSPPYKNQFETTALQLYVVRCAQLLSSAGGNEEIDFWQTLAPQAAWSCPSFRYALISLSLGMQFNIYDCQQVAGQNSWITALKYQNMAISQLFLPGTPSIVVVLAAMAFWLLALYSGDWQTACRHSNAVLRLVSDLAKYQSAEHETAIQYMQQLSQRCVDFFGNVYYPQASDSGSSSRKEPGSEVTVDLIADITTFFTVRPLLSSLAIDVVEKPLSAHQQIYFSAMCEVIAIQHKQRHLISHLEAVFLDPLSSTSSAATNQTTRQHDFIAGVLPIVRMYHQMITFVCERWASAPYLNTYLHSFALVRRFQRFRSSFDIRFTGSQSVGFATMDTTALPEVPYQSPLLTVIDDLSQELIFLTNSFAAGIHHTVDLQGREILAGDIPPEPRRTNAEVLPTEFKELLDKVGFYIHFFLILAAGRDRRLRRDIMDFSVLAKQAGDDAEEAMKQLSLSPNELNNAKGPGMG